MLFSNFIDVLNFKTQIFLFVSFDATWVYFVMWDTYLGMTITLNWGMRHGQGRPWCGTVKMERVPLLSKAAPLPSQSWGNAFSALSEAAPLCYDTFVDCLVFFFSLMLVNKFSSSMPNIEQCIYKKKVCRSVCLQLFQVSNLKLCISIVFGFNLLRCNIQYDFI